MSRCLSFSCIFFFDCLLDSNMADCQQYQQSNDFHFVFSIIALFSVFTFFIFFSTQSKHKNDKIQRKIKTAFNANIVWRHSDNSLVHGVFIVFFSIFGVFDGSLTALSTSVFNLTTKAWNKLCNSDPSQPSVLILPLLHFQRCLNLMNMPEEIHQKRSNSSIPKTKSSLLISQTTPSTSLFIQIFWIVSVTL